MAGNLMVIKFYGSPLNRLGKKLMDFDFMETQFCAWCGGDSFIVGFHGHLVYEFNFTVLPLTVTIKLNFM